jgi:hypothetical protein
MFDTLADNRRGPGSAEVDEPAVQARLDVDLAEQIGTLLGAMAVHDGADWAGREFHLARLLGDDILSLQETPIRRVLLLVEEFRKQCRIEANARVLAVVLKAVIARACQAFSVVTQGRRGATRFGPDNDSCLVDLLKLLNALNADEMPSPFDLAHAMDALIIQLVRIESEIEETGLPRRRLRLTAP